MKQKIQNFLPAECPWRDTLHWFTSLNSTNELAKTMAKNGAPEGTVVLAGHQSAGKGRLGRSFASPEGMGIYLSLLLRPDCPAERLMHLTCAAAVAACDAVEEVCGIRPSIKWINDLILGKKKLGGILTELCVEQGIVQYAVIGIGINCSQKTEDFPEDIQNIAISLESFTGKPVNQAKLIGSLVSHLYKMNCRLFSWDFMANYCRDCVTLGQEISIVRGDEISHGKAVGLDPQGGLIVAYADGSGEIVNSGEVSIRGMYGYV